MEFIDIESKVKKILMERFQCRAEEDFLSSRMVEDLGLDHAETFELIAEAEEKCGATIPEDQLENIRTVGDLARQLKQSIPD